MKMKVNSLCVILLVILSVSIGGCSLKSEPYNIVITNNSGDSIQSIGYYKENSSGGVVNADNSPIESGQEFKMYIESNHFNLKVSIGDDMEYISPEFDVNFETNENKIYKISIEKDSLGNLEFILSE